VDLDEPVEPISPEVVRPAHGGVDREHHTELLGGLVNRVELAMAEREPQADRGKEHPDRVLLEDTSPELLDSLADVL
jgi:hypothetical protein